MTEWAKQMNARQEAGMCRACGKPRDGTNKHFCIEHHERHLSQLRERRELKVKAGLCAVGGCKKKKHKGGMCFQHYCKQQEYHKAHRQRKKRAPDGTGG